MTSKVYISLWFDEGVEEGNTHMLVVCDTFSYEDYPVYVKKGEDVHDRVKYYDGRSMQRVMEVYVLDPKKKDNQLSDLRAWHLESLDSSS